MMLQSSDRSILARDLGLGEGSDIPRRGVAALLRSALSRWGLSPRRALTRYARQQLEATHLVEQWGTDFVDNVLDQMQTVRECDEVLIGGERYVAPGYSRLIRTGVNTATLLGVDPLPEDVSVWEPPTQWDVLRRVRFNSEAVIEKLYGSGFKECSIDSWLRPLHYLRHHRRRIGRPFREDRVALRNYWELLVETVTAEGRPVGSDADLRILGGTPGAHFGKHTAPRCEGRWTTETDDGVWCGYRQGYGDPHWHPVIVAVDGTERRLIDLYDHDEWRWALLARAQATGVHEVIQDTGEVVTLTFRMPDQLKAAMDLLGPRAGAWAWQVPEDGPRFWSDLV